MALDIFSSYISRDIPELPEREEGEGEESELQNAAYSNWNQPRRVELWREPSKSLGISIVGGRGMGSRLSNGEVMRGIFIKHVLEDSPAGRNGTLKPGDRIVEVLSSEPSVLKSLPSSMLCAKGIVIFTLVTQPDI
uniref:Multiple PDZ domain crumbs cell polarity complex component n=1 Tax=Molossus molossus TaxID=27622 RepID=A0A7J8EFC0_MOLMO|nr:multiple PDZ domain crumbs cell polarity complex component [Molossus molossus]